MSVWSQLSFQDSNSSTMENMIMFYDHAMMVVLMIVILILYMLVFMLFNNFIDRTILEGQMIEIVWTMIPMMFLFMLAVPSLKILYLMDEINNPVISVKVIGHQWYWSYEYSDFLKISFDSFMISNLEELNLFRLLDVDNRLILPYNIQIRMLVISSDVIHSFALPVLSMKIDAMPGRINQMNIQIFRPGLYYGQCSEICGVNHSFMPIVIESVNYNLFLNWMNCN